MTNELATRIEEILGSEVTRTSPLAVGFGLEGWRIRLADGRELAVKAERGTRARTDALWAPPLEIEAFMLRELRRLPDLPVPQVHFADATMLVMDFIDNDGGAISPSVERHAAELVARLHSVAGEAFGYHRDTLIGPLVQANPPHERWVPFFAEHRLLAMGQAAMREGALPATEMKRLEMLAGRLDRYLTEPPHPSLLHGDLWTGNVLVKGGRIAGFVDPAIYFGHPEIELAFGTLFGTFGNAFFDAYETSRPLEPDFHEARKPLYNLYPLLVHVRLFGGGYLDSVRRTLDRFGI